MRDKIDKSKQVGHGVMLQVHSWVSCYPKDCTPTCTVWKWAVEVYTGRTLAVVAIPVVNACSAVLTRTASTQVQVCAACVPRVACCACTGEAVERIDAGASILTCLTHTVVYQISTRLPGVPHGAGAGELPTFTGSTIFTTHTAVICCAERIKPCPYLTVLPHSLVHTVTLWTCHCM